MSETLVKWWADITKSSNPLHERLPIIERQQVYIASDVDAILRQREEEIERLKQQVVPAPFDESHPDPNEIIATLNAQLAAMVEQRAQDGLDGQAALDMLNNQLSTSQARCVQLEDALKLCVKAWNHDGEPSAISYEMAIETACKALTPTERPPT